MEAANERSAKTFALIAVMLWSTVATVFKLGLSVLAIEQLLALGSATSWLIFLCNSAWRGQWRLRAKEVGWVVLMGVINPFAYYLILFGAYDRLPAHIAQPLNYTWAITLALLAIPILKQRLSRLAGTGILVSYSGVVLLLSYGTPPDANGWDLWGVVLALASTLLWAVYWLINTRCQSPPASLMFWSFSVALPLVLVACYIGPGWPAISLQTVTFGVWVGAIEMGITFLLWQAALKRTAHTARIAQLIFISPFLSMALIYWQLDETITPGAIFGLVVIVAGLFITQRN